MALSLHVAPHQTEAQPWLAILGDETRDDRVERSLAGLEPVEMVPVQRELTTTVLKRKTEAGRDVIRPESVKVALDQADGVEVVVDDRQVDGIGLFGVARGRAKIGLFGS